MIACNFYDNVAVVANACIYILCTLLYRLSMALHDINDLFVCSIDYTFMYGDETS